jgi:hypothetical protein
MNHRFRIRDLFWAIVVFGMAVGWWVDSRQSASKIEMLKGGAAKMASAQGGIDISKLQVAKPDDPQPYVWYQRANK